MSDSNNGSYKVWEPLLLAIVAVVSLIGGVKISDKMNDSSTERIATGSGQISEIVRFIEEQYVDEINSGDLMETAVNSILKELDPHSGYISPEELRDINERMEGHFDGIGVQFHILRDSLVVLFVNPDGPADKAGIEAHDRIIFADEMSLVGLGKDEEGEMDIVQSLRGEKGTSLEVQVARNGIDSLLTFNIQRDEIKIESVVAGYMLTDNTGYIRINNFSASTFREFMTHLEKLADNPEFDHLVIDLRENPGGYLKEAINILSQLFQEKGELLVYTEGEHAKRMEYHTSGKPFYKVDNIAVLIDGGSASASEIIAGAIQDHDRGVILGTKSYGKGLVQEQFNLRNGGALRLTVARYYTPSGRCIQKPYSGGVNTYNGSAEDGDSVAYRTTNGRMVMADGGIDPDIVVPAKFDWYNGKAFLSYGELLEYMFYGFDDPYQDEYEDMEVYLDAMPQSDEMMADFAAFIELDRTDEDWAAFEADWERAYTMIRAMACSYRYGYEAWYKVMNMDDPVISKAIEVVQEDMRTTLKY